MLAVFTLLFAFILFPHSGPSTFTYKLGDIAKKDIKASKDFFIQDKEATELNRDLAVKSVLTVYDHNTILSNELSQRIRKVFGEYRAIFDEKETTNLTNSSATPNDDGNTSISAAGIPETSPHALVWAKKPLFEQKLGLKVSKETYQSLEKKKFSIEIENLICQILFKVLDNGIVANKEILRRNLEKGITLVNVANKEEKVVQNLKKFYGLDQAQEVARIIAEPLFKNVDYEIRGIVVDFTLRLLQPNITLNRSETEERKKRAESEIGVTLFRVKAGEMILREGDRVSQTQLVRLKEMMNENEKSRIGATLKNTGVALIVILLLATMYAMNLMPRNEKPPTHNKNILFIISILAGFLFIAKISASVPGVINATVSFDIPDSAVLFGMPLSAGAMTVCLFMGLEVALPFALVFALLVALLFDNQLSVFIFFLLSGTVGAFWTSDCRERKVFIKAGAKTGLLNVFFSSAIIIYSGETSLEIFLWSWLFAFSGGVAAGIVTAGLGPLIEMMFDYTTDIKLLELANLEQPLLRRLMIEAPGTYNHSVIVGTMADAVASEIGANPLLARVCGYYHDIGKIEKAQYFIENQQGGKNKHDKLAPSMSALIITGHIKNGVEIAKKYKLGKPIIDTIKQHHGTSTLEFFYEKAKSQLKEGDQAINHADFQYPGPKPQTIEAGIVMIADVVEAASRTLDDPTPARIQGLVQNLINKIFSDGQLDYCEITLKDLHSIAKRFNQILSGIHHHRIKYPEKTPAANGKVKNGDSNKQSATETQGESENNPGQSSAHLKRLGIT